MQLIIFFNGWGMNEKILKNISLDKNFELLHIGFPYKVPKINFTSYEKIFVIGWSFGVFYASKFLLENPNLNCFSIAINGTPYTIGEFGISPKMFKLTCDNLSLATLKLFYKNMGVYEEIDFDNVDIQNLQLELFELQSNTFDKHHIFNKAFLGKNDRIIPYSKQLKFFTKEKTNIVTLECEHYPFKVLTNWGKIINENNEF
nr:pimeloyl-ACP methyl esterase BioG family protein [uncultured Cetobacterium sp.]